jgi:ribonuclease BN (tRNA processing enzyme)
LAKLPYFRSAIRACLLYRNLPKMGDGISLANGWPKTQQIKMSEQPIPRTVLPSIPLLCLVTFSLFCPLIPAADAQTCGTEGVAVQVLGSGGPDLQDKRASSSYLVWQDGQARVLVDAGGGSALRFGESGAKMSQLDVILFTHFHVDHSADFPSLIFSSWFEGRDRPLPVYGPAGNRDFPSTVDFVHAFFNSRNGVYRYLSVVLVAQENGGYELQPHSTLGDPSSIAFRGEHLSAYAARVVHGSVPALAWRVEIGGKSIVFSGDTNGEGTGLVQLAKDADLFIAHNAIPEGATGVERWLHMPPSVIGQIAQEAHVKRLVLSHRMLRTLGKEEQSQSEISKTFSGPVTFANDLDCFPVP